MRRTTAEIQAKKKTVKSLFDIMTESVARRDDEMWFEAITQSALDAGVAFQQPTPACRLTRIGCC